MAQIKIYCLSDALAQNRDTLSEAIHRSVIEVLDYPPEKKFHRFFGMRAEDFMFPPNRSPSYTVIEISMFEGRSVETKKALLRALFINIEQACGITPHDIEVTIFETPRENWGIRGKPGDELMLNYKVHV